MSKTLLDEPNEAVAVRQPQAIQPAEADETPMINIAAMFERVAQNPDIAVDKLQALMEMQRQAIADHAKASFNAAFAKMQPEIPVIIEYARTDKTSYAPLEDIVEAVRPILAKHGFGISHKTEWPEKGIVRIIGILSHRDGHERQSEFLTPPDSSGSKNAVQGLGSAMAYGRRYTTKDLLNIVTRGEDDDARRAARLPAPEGYDEWLEALSAKADEGLPALQNMWKVANGDDQLREYALHLTAAEPATWQALKTKAAKVKAVSK